MENVKRYGEMKDSGVEWIGEIPKHWEVIRLKRLCSSITDGAHFSPETAYQGFPYITATDIHGKGLDYANAKCISESDFLSLQAQGCQPQRGDVLLVKDGATTGRVGLMTDDTPCVMLSSVAMLRHSADTHDVYLMYLLMSEIIQAQIRLSMAGAAMPRTTLTKLVKYLGIKCPLPEQQAIASYLDDKCSAIDDIIASSRASIDDYKQLKASTIYEAVTKGLNPDVEMKDSGVEWIGEIPDSWSILKYKYLLEIHSGDGIINSELSDEGSYPVFGGGDIIGYYSKSNVQQNCILIGRVGARCGCVTITNCPSWATDNALIINTNCCVKYIYYLLVSSNLMK